MSTSKKILVAPLDWGLGHSTRCVPLIEKFCREGHTVIIAATGVGAAYLRKRFPLLELVDSIPPYNVTYPENGKMFFHFMKDSRRLFGVIQNEHRWLEHFLQKNKMDEVYSDNRYGLHSKLVPCHLITHQLFIRVPFFLKPWVNRRIRGFIRHFTSCLVPDHEGTQNLSGALSHAKKVPSNVHYIGPLSRFKEPGMYEINPESGYSIMAIVSGPEPQRSRLQSILTNILESIDRPSLIVCGQPEKNFDDQLKHVRIVSHLEDDLLAMHILSCRTLICRSGYSTIMDLDKLKKQAILIPTPGQTEQEYLASYHHRSGRHFRILQSELNKDKILHAHKKMAFAIEYLAEKIHRTS